MTWRASWVAGRWLPLLACLLVAVGWTYWTGRSHGRAAAEAAWADATAEAGRRFGEALAAQQRVLIDAETALERVRGQRQAVRTVVREVYRDDPASFGWARQPLPDRLRDAAGRALGLPTDSAEPAAGLF